PTTLEPTVQPVVDAAAGSPGTDLSLDDAAMRDALSDIQKEAIANGDPIPGIHEPGPYAGDGVPVENGAPTNTKGITDAVNAEGAKNGCHICGAQEPGTLSGNWFKDHSPSTAVSDGGPQLLYPSCRNCSNLQGWLVANLQRLQLWYNTIG